MLRLRRSLSGVMFTIALAACRSRQPASARGSGGSATLGAADSIPARGAAVAKPSLGDSARASPSGGVDSALAVLRGYYAALNARAYTRAYAAWADDGPPGRPTLAVFAAGYAGTDSVELTLGTPGRVEGAAGSRYVSVPVSLRAFQRGGRQTVFAGTYTLRRSVVPGADAPSRRWHLYSAALHPRAVR